MAGSSHTCALLEDKSVECWGRHYDGSSFVNHIAPSLNNAKALVAGRYHTCALKEDKSVECWGKHVGITNINLEETPRILVAGYWHTCALKEDKSITCWGKHNYRSYFLAPGSNSVIVTNP